MAAPAAGERLTLLLSLVPYLIERGRVSVSEAARHFSVDEERIRAAVRLIAVSGVPGETSQYQPGDLFDIAWDDFEMDDHIKLTHRVAIDDSPRFSAREAAALIAGLQYVSALPENADREAVGSLMAKLTRGASQRPSQVAVAGSFHSGTLATVRTTLDAGTQLEFDYLNARGDRDRRRVDPLRLDSVDQDWYLRAWCHAREAVRTFRLDRMSEVRAVADPISHQPSDVTLPESLFEPSKEDQLVRVELPANALDLVADYRPEKISAPDRRGRVRAVLRVAHYHGLVRLAARLSGVLTVQDPPAARQAVADWAAAGLARYDP